MVANSSEEPAYKASLEAMEDEGREREQMVVVVLDEPMSSRLRT